MNLERSRCAVSAILGLAVVVLFAAAAACPPAAGDTKEATAPPKPTYVRIIVSPESALYVQFEGAEMRIAPTPHGLKDAKAVRGRRQPAGVVEFPAVDLALPPSALPAGVSKVTSQFRVYGSRGGAQPAHRSVIVLADLELQVKDSKGAVWAYQVRKSATGADAPAEASGMPLPQPKNLTLLVTAQTSTRRVGAVLRLSAGRTDIDDVRRDGKSVEAQVRILNSSGKAVASAKGPLAKFGTT